MALQPPNFWNEAGTVKRRWIILGLGVLLGLFLIFTAKHLF